MGREFKRLQINEGGRMTLEGKVVPARRIGPPVMAFWTAEFPKKGGEFITNTEKLPVLSLPYLPKGVNAYALALGPKPVETIITNSEIAPSGVFVSDTERYQINARRWTAVQFYRVPRGVLNNGKK